MVKQILKSYGISVDQVELEKTNLGHINEVYFVKEKEYPSKNKYILRKINNFVFPSPENVIHNYDLIWKEFNSQTTEYKIRIPKLYYSVTGKPFSIDNDGNYWMMVEYIDNSYSVDTLIDYDVMKKAAECYAIFEKCLSNLNPDLMKTPLPNFHDWNGRIEKLIQCSKQSEMKEKASNEINILLSDENVNLITNIINYVKTLPDRITHNDTKLSNILFDKRSNLPVAIVDLDTVMPGKRVYDFGDMVRSFCNSAAEDEKNLESVEFNEYAFEAILTGYLSEAKDFLTAKEIELLLPAAKLLIFIQAVRFLTDYLMGNVYYRVEYTDHNLIRTRNQIKLFNSLTEKESLLLKIIKTTYSNL